jgi:signal transduction histidine kinase/DNA-binding response OmpR family regulator
MVRPSGDITETKRREVELQTSRAKTEHPRELLQIVLDSMTDGIALIEADGRCAMMNRALFQINGFPAELADLKFVQEIFRWQVENGHIPRRCAMIEQDVALLEKWFAEAGGKPLVRHRPNGRWVESRCLRLADERRLVMHRDVTELKEQEERIASERDAADAANRAKSTFLATMSHEIRTPMNGVLGMIEVLERQDLNEVHRRTVSVMRDSAQALLRIIDDVLDFSKIESGRLELEATAFSLSGLIEGALDTVRPQATAKSLVLEASNAGSDDALLGDPTRIRQILLNLLSNAVKFTAQGRVQLSVSTTPLGEATRLITIAVSDTGIGLHADQCARLFQPFAQADSSTTRRFGGSGLGLSIVRRLAQLMQGDVVVDSVPGAGSTFTVTLTLMAAPVDSPLKALSQPQPAPARDARPESDPRILIVDDHPVNREVLMLQLKLLGFETDMANDGVEALEAWAPGRYAAVLADIHMPRLDGHELTRRMRAAEAERSAPRTPIVAITADAMRGEEERCLAVGMDAYLAKPVTIDRLRETLERWFPTRDADEASPKEHSVFRAAAIDPNVLSGWLGNDSTATQSLLEKFRETAIEAEREINTAARERNLAWLAAAAHKLGGAKLSVRVALLPRPPR